MSTGTATGKQQKSAAAAATAQPETTIERVAKPRAKAQVCPSCGGEHTRIYKTEGRVRRCVCDTCGNTWKQTGPFADELREYALQFADALKAQPLSEIEGTECLVFDRKFAEDLEKTFRRLATT